MRFRTATPPYHRLATLGAFLLLLLAGCNRGGGKPRALQFWHTRTLTQEKALKAIVDEFNATSGGPPIVPVYMGDYPDVRTKVIAGIAAHRLPLLSVCYESHVQA